MNNKDIKKAWARNIMHAPDKYVGLYCLKHSSPDACLSFDPTSQSYLGNKPTNNFRAPRKGLK